MKEYTGDLIRNVAIVGHGGAGTTSLTEALLYRSHTISRMCKVEDGQTTTDFEPEEIKRGVSVSATLAPLEWEGVKINFIDTPGFADFVAEVKGAFRAVDSVLIVVSATSGVQIGTEQCWKLAEEVGLPRLIFVNKMDRENADYDNILDNLRAKIGGKKILPLELPLGKEENFCGVIDVFLCVSAVMLHCIYNCQSLTEQSNGFVKILAGIVHLSKQTKHVLSDSQSVSLVAQG